MTTIFVDEEYGYRFWLWETEMSRQEVIEFWKSIESMEEHFMDPSKTMPGTWKQVQHSTDKVAFKAHMHMDNDSSLHDTSTGIAYLHKGYRQNMIELDVKELANLLIARAKDFEIAAIEYDKNMVHEFNSKDNCKCALVDVEEVIEELNRKVK